MHFIHAVELSTAKAAVTLLCALLAPALFKLLGLMKSSVLDEIDNHNIQQQ